MFFINFLSLLNAEEKITTIPLINLENLEPSFEKEDSSSQSILDKENLFLKEKKIKENKNKATRINIIALDKITAKTSDINLFLGETKKFGLLEIKALKCQLSDKSDIIDAVAYLQVKDLSVKDNNQVFLFNGWTFASSPTLQSIDHPIYDLWITSCENI